MGPKIPGGTPGQQGQVRYLKAVLARRYVDSSEVNHVPKLAVGVVPEEGQHWNHPIRMDHHLQLIVASHLCV